MVVPARHDKICEQHSVWKNSEKNVRWRFWMHFFDFTISFRFCYGKMHRNSDFFEETLVENTSITRYARITLERDIFRRFPTLWEAASECCRWSPLGFHVHGIVIKVIRVFSFSILTRCNTSQFCWHTLYFYFIAHSYTTLSNKTCFFYGLYWATTSNDDHDNLEHIEGEKTVIMRGAHLEIMHLSF